ncbi:MAG: hypothetical protein HOV80_17345 [Polyangiaceae bacterium]|nr:hypothetical protein [Polyangiaceae bacterium]
MGSARMLGAAVSAALLLSGCTPSDEGGGATSASAAPGASSSTVRAVPIEVDAAFFFAEVQRAPSAPPERFAAPLPSSLDKGYPDRGDIAPKSYVVELLCAGDAAMIHKLGVAAAADREAGKDPTIVALGVHNLVRDCDPTPNWCRSVAKLAGDSDASNRFVGTAMLAECGRAEDIELFDRRETNALSVFHYLAARRLGKPKPVFTARVGRAALELAAALEDARELRAAAVTLASFDDRHATQALFGMRDTAKAHKRQIAVAGLESKDPEAQEMGRDACDSELLRRDPVCLREGPLKLDVPKGPREDLKHPERMTLERVAVLADDPHVGKNLGITLEACARVRETAFDCIVRLQLFDKKRAAQLARKLSARQTFEERELASALTKYEAAGALEKRVLELGFRPLGKRATDADRLRARDILRASGHVASFDADTDRIPPGHDALLFRLSRLGGTDLAGVLFEETPPEGDGAPYRVCAFARGERWCTNAKNLAGRYDLDATLGLLNAMSRDLGLVTRFATLTTADGTAHVVGGPAMGITTLIGEGLVEREAR